MSYFYILHMSVFSLIYCTLGAKHLLCGFAILQNKEEEKKQFSISNKHSCWIDEVSYA